MGVVRRCFGMMAATMIGLSAGLIGATPVAAESSQGDLLALLDASGSMEEPAGAGSGTKIEAARKAMHGVADALPDDARVGLRAYGPRSTGRGCKASKLLAPIGPIDRDKLKSTVDGLRTGGDTPIAYSLRQSAKDFSGDRPRTILLISDGEETCGGDPVAVAKKITKEHPNLKIDVVGFRVKAKARDQLANIAQVGRGRYIDARDGAALSARLKRESIRAIRGFRAAGTPVTGSADGENPPVLKPGQYRDEMPPNHGSERPSRFYAFDMPKGASGYFSAVTSWSTPLGTDIKIELGTTVTAAETGQVCYNRIRYWYAEYGGGGAASVGARSQVPYDPDAGEGECGAPGRYLVQVHNNEDTTRTGAAPLELSIVVEPGASTKGLPGPYQPEGEPVRPKADGTPEPVSGAGSYSDAPVIRDGVYSDTLRPGEEVFYRVPLDWGQRLSYQMRLPKLDAERKESLGHPVEARTTIENPLRTRAVNPDTETDVSYGGDPVAGSGSTVPVRYRNRESTDEITQATSLPGYYYIWLRMAADAEDPYFEVPVTLEVDVTGKVSGEPKYDDPEGLGSPDEQLEVELASSGDGGKPPAESPGTLPVALLWVGAGVGGLLLLGGAGAAVVVLSRRR